MKNFSKKVFIRSSKLNEVKNSYKNSFIIEDVLNNKQNGINLEAFEITKENGIIKVKCKPTSPDIDLEKNLLALDFYITKCLGGGKINDLIKKGDHYEFEIMLSNKTILRDVKGFKISSFKKAAFNVIVGCRPSGKPLLVNMTQNPHFVITGQSGTGKTRLVWAILTIMLMNFSADDFKFIIIKFAKDEFDKFKYCANCLGIISSENPEEIEEFLDKKIKELEKVEEDINSKNCGGNIDGYSSVFKFYKKRHVPLFILIDEFSFLNDMVKTKNSPGTNKNEFKTIATLVEGIIKKGRSSGAYLLAMLQRPTYDQMSPTMRSQLTRITFRQQDMTSGVAAIGNEGAARAIKLERQEALISLDGDILTFYVPNIDHNIISNSVGPEKLYATCLTKLKASEILEKYGGLEEKDYVPVAFLDDETIAKSIMFITEQEKFRIIGEKLGWNEDKINSMWNKCRSYRKKRSDNQYAG